MKIDKLRVGPHGKFRIAKRAAEETFGVSKTNAEKQTAIHVQKLQTLHELLYAENQRSLLIVLQGMDAAGKDGTIKHVMSGVNPQGCVVTPFKQPGALELAHDFLWRIHAAVPPRGAIGIFNRSHYEDVLIARVHQLATRKVWERRYDQINEFEKTLTQNGVHILKFFLHLSSAEQQRRFEDRLNDPHKNWKASTADFTERKHWDEYQKAYEDVLRKCDTDYAPWLVVPSDHKWFRNYAVAEVIVQRLQSMKMHFPPPDAAVVELAKSLPAAKKK